MNNNILNKIELFLNESKILGLKKEGITTVNAGIPGEGPIADVQNGLKGPLEIDIEARKKNRKMRNQIFRRVLIDEKIKISIDEIIEAFGGMKQLKKFKSFREAWNYVEKNIDEISDVLNIKRKEIPMEELQEKIKSLFS